MVNAKISRLRCVVLFSVFIYNIMENGINETNSQGCYISNQDTFLSLKEIQ